MEWQWFLFLLPALLIITLVTLMLRLSRGTINPRPGAPRRLARSSDNASTATDAGTSGDGSGQHSGGESGGDCGGGSSD